MEFSIESECLERVSFPWKLFIPPKSVACSFSLPKLEIIFACYVSRASCRPDRRPASMFACTWGNAREYVYSHTLPVFVIHMVMMITMAAISAVLNDHYEFHLLRMRDLTVLKWNQNDAPFLLSVSAGSALVRFLASVLMGLLVDVATLFWLLNESPTKACGEEN